MGEYIVTCDEETAAWIGNDVDSMQPIVRCGDCLSWFRGRCYKHVFTMTIDGAEYEEGAFPMDASGFCSLGKPRGDAE